MTGESADQRPTRPLGPAIVPECDADEYSKTSQEEGAGQSDSSSDQNMTKYVKLLEHAYECRTEICGSKNCVDMKKYIKHARHCQSKVRGGCMACKRLWRLLRAHALGCQDSNSCPVPQCASVRQKLNLQLIPSVPRRLSSVPRTKLIPSHAQRRKPSLVRAYQLANHASTCGAQAECYFPGCPHAKQCLARCRMCVPDDDSA